MKDSEGRLFAEVKRFRETWIGDDRFRRAVRADPAAAAAGVGLDIDPLPLAPLWDPSAPPASADSPEGCADRRIHALMQTYLDFCDNDTGAAEPYRAWRARQHARAAFAQGMVTAPISLHLPFAVELTQGCSLGCWFCGLSASPLKAVLPTDLDAWERMLEALYGIFGESAVRGFLYWATDPLDHPDYEAYGEVFRRVLGRFPATTTAAPLVDLARTRALMVRAREGDCPSLRFSVVSRRQLDEIHAAFSAEDLVDIDLAIVNRESVLALAEAGHHRRKAGHWPERVALDRHKLAMYGDEEIFAHRTIACVSGFLIEPVPGRIRLISPEPSSERWPEGYVVFDEAHFGDTEAFALALDRIVRRNMKPDPPEHLALQRGVTVKAKTQTTVEAEGRGHLVTFLSRRRDLNSLPALAEMFRGGARLDDAVRHIADAFGIAPAVIRRDAVDLWQQGVLVEPIFSFSSAEERFPVALETAG